ncbi:MAG: rhodanese-like domain-containing protein [Campylobacterota bacterium]
MRKIGLCIVLISTLFAKDISFEQYLQNFDYKERAAMKIKSSMLLFMIDSGEDIQIIDIRFKDEYDAWNMGFGKNIPLDELPHRLDEIDKDKFIVTMCPHNDRSNMARTYLTLRGYNAGYLSDGMLRLADHLRGERAKEIMESVKKHGY